jgi:hypothetical protein
MNIFATSPDPYECAANLDDKRVVKMCLETAQLISTAAESFFPFIEIFDAPLLKPAFVNHPCSVWTRSSLVHFKWLSRHGEALCNVYQNVYGRQHKCAELFSYFSWPMDTPQPEYFANCAANASLGVSFKHIPDTHEAYRMYLTSRWRTDKRRPTWQKRTWPIFVLDYIDT